MLSDKNFSSCCFWVQLTKSYSLRVHFKFTQHTSAGIRCEPGPDSQASAEQDCARSSPGGGPLAAQLLSTPFGRRAPYCPDSGQGGWPWEQGKGGATPCLVREGQAGKSSAVQQPPSSGCTRQRGGREEPARPSWNVKAAVGVAKGQGEN